MPNNSLAPVRPDGAAALSEVMAPKPTPGIATALPRKPHECSPGPSRNHGYSTAGEGRGLGTVKDPCLGSTPPRIYGRGREPSCARLCQKAGPEPQHLSHKSLFQVLFTALKENTQGALLKRRKKKRCQTEGTPLPCPGKPHNAARLPPGTRRLGKQGNRPS